MRTATPLWVVFVSLQLAGCPIDGQSQNFAADAPESPGDTGGESADVRSAKFFGSAVFAATFGRPVTPPSAFANMTVDLLDRYVPIDASVTAEALPYYVAGGLRQMFLQSTTHERDGGSRFMLHQLRQNPTTPYWANCGSAVDTMIIMLASFGVDARPVSMWNTLSDGHIALEYYSEQFRQYVYYDPLYGAFMVDKDGRPADVAALVEQIDRYGFDSLNWDYQPIRISNVFSDDYVEASDPAYEYYNGLDYRVILENYFRVIAVRERDLSSFQHIGLGTVPGEEFDRGGQWMIRSFVDGAEWSEMKEAMLDLFDVSRGGRYHLHFLDP